MVLPIYSSQYPCESLPCHHCRFSLTRIYSFLVFTDYGIYWVHRTLHHPSIYKYVHKPHHKWLSMSCFSLQYPSLIIPSTVPTPFASHAFHPLDGYLQSVPYHLFIFIFPLHRWLYLGLFVFVNFWSILVRFCCALLMSQY